nr:hypothetical protein [Tanacetum cinerariifolium]
MLTGKWTPMNREVSKFNSLVNETQAMSGEHDADLMTRIEILYRAQEKSDFKHKSAWNFLKGKHKSNNSESTNARRNRHRLTNNEPELFGDDELPRPTGLHRIAKSQRSSNSTASSEIKTYVQKQCDEDDAARHDAIIVVTKLFNQANIAKQALREEYAEGKDIQHERRVGQQIFERRSLERLQD